jgi:hypothetical protein
MLRLSRPTASVNRTQKGERRLWAGNVKAVLTAQRAASRL